MLMFMYLSTVRYDDDDRGIHSYDLYIYDMFFI